MKRQKETGSPAIAPEVEERILSIRGQRVIIDADLAALYGTTISKRQKATRVWSKEVTDSLI